MTIFHGAYHSSPAAEPLGPSRHDTPAALAVAPLLFGTGMALLWVALHVLPTPSEFRSRLLIAVAGVLFIGAGAGVLVRWRCRRLGGLTLARLGPAYVVYFTFSFGVSALAWVKPQGGSRSVVDPSFVPGAVAAAGFGLLAWSLGYALGPPKLVKHSAAAVQRLFAPGNEWVLRFSALPVALFLVSMAARATQLSAGTYGYFQDASATLAGPSPVAQLVSAVQSLSLYALVLAVIDALLVSRDLRSRITLATLALIEVTFGFFAASKETVILTLLVITLATVFIRGRLPRATLTVAVAVVLVLFPFNRAYRQTIRGNEAAAVSPAVAVAKLPGVAANAITDTSPRTLLLDTPALIAARVRQIDNIAIIRQRTPGEIPWRPWAQLASGPATGLVPRAIWPNKPVLSTGRDFSVKYYKIPRGSYTATAVTVPGDLYRHGGFAPLIAGMLLLGTLARMVDVSLDPGRDARLLLPFVAMFVLLIKSESDVTVLVLGLLKVAVLSTLLCRLAFVTPRRS